MRSSQRKKFSISDKDLPVQLAGYAFLVKMKLLPSGKRLVSSRFAGKNDFR
jgi:hypothetical protein